MERTELREAFFAEARYDPYLHAVTHHVAEAWANGYEQALRDHGLTEARLEKTHSERHQDALEWLTGARREADAKALIAFAEMGRLFTESKVVRG